MKKKLLVAALVAGFAAFTGVAQAEDSVVLYGTLDGGLGFNTYTIKKVDSNTKVEKTTNAGRGVAFESNVNQASNIGFKGAALIFGTTTGIFKLESGLNVLTGAGGKFQGNFNSLFDRAAYFGFTSPEWGAFTIGRQDSASKSLKLLPFGNFAIGTALPGDMKDGTFNPASAFNGTVYGNAGGNTSANVKYVSPRFLGLEFGASYDFNLTLLADSTSPTTFHTASDQSKQHFSTGVNFALGAVNLAATYDLYRPIGVPYAYAYNGKDKKIDADADNNEHAYTLGASVNLRGVVVQGSWSQAFSKVAFKFGQASNVGQNIASKLYSTFFTDTNSTGNPVASTQKWRNNAFSLSVTVPATEQGKFYFQYSGALTSAKRVFADSADPFKMDAAKPETDVKAFSQLWRAGYVQNLSKLTSLYIYAGFGDVKFSEKATTKSDWNSSDRVGTAQIQQYGIGITHRF